MQNTELPPYDAFYSKLRSCNPLEAEYTDYVNLPKSASVRKTTLKSAEDHRTSRLQIKTFKATTYWDRKLSIPATNMEAGTNELIQRIFALL